MTQYVIAYLGGEQPTSAEQSQAHFAAFKQWLTSLGDAAISPANPLQHTTTVASDGKVSAGGSTGMSGFTIVQARSMDEALAIAKSCPFLLIGGTLEVSQLIQMPN